MDCDIFHEAHIEHFVRFIQNHRLNVVQADRLAVDVVEQTSRRTDDDLRFLLQCADLTADVLTAINRQANENLCNVSSFPISSADLNGKLTGRRHDERYDAVFRYRNLVHERDSEGSRFTRSCLCLTDQVGSGQRNRDGFGLDRGRFLKPQLRNGLQNFRFQAKFSKCFQTVSISFYLHPTENIQFIIAQLRFRIPARTNYTY